MRKAPPSSATSWHMATSVARSLTTTCVMHPMRWSGLGLRLHSSVARQHDSLLLARGKTREGRGCSDLVAPTRTGGTAPQRPRSARRDAGPGCFALTSEKGASLSSGSRCSPLALSLSSSCSGARREPTKPSSTGRLGIFSARLSHPGPTCTDRGTAAQAGGAQRLGGKVRQRGRRTSSVMGSTQPALRHCLANPPPAPSRHLLVPTAPHANRRTSSVMGSAQPAPRHCLANPPPAPSRHLLVPTAPHANRRTSSVMGSAQPAPRHCLANPPPAPSRHLLVPTAPHANRRTSSVMGSTQPAVARHTAAVRPPRPPVGRTLQKA